MARSPEFLGLLLFSSTTSTELSLPPSDMASYRYSYFASCNWGPGYPSQTYQLLPECCPKAIFTHDPGCAASLHMVWGAQIGGDHFINVHAVLQVAE